MTDTFHIVFTMITVPLMMLIIGFGAAGMRPGFRTYSIVTLVILIAAGVVTGMDGPKISKNLPTPWVGVWERINIGVYMAWIVVFAIDLLKKEGPARKIRDGSAEASAKHLSPDPLVR